MDELCKIEAHDAEVLSLEYSQAVQGAATATAGKKAQQGVASRKRLVALGLGLG